MTYKIWQERMQELSLEHTKEIAQIIDDHQAEIGEYIFQISDLRDRRRADNDSMEAMWKHISVMTGEILKLRTDKLILERTIEKIHAKRD